MCKYKRTMQKTPAKQQAKAFAVVATDGDAKLVALQAAYDAQQAAFEAYKIANVNRKFIYSGANVVGLKMSMEWRLPVVCLWRFLEAGVLRLIIVCCQ